MTRARTSWQFQMHNTIRWMSTCFLFCAREMSESISQGVTANRPGPAGGLLQLNEESYSHTKVTQQPTSLKLAASSKGVAMRKIYYNGEALISSNCRCVGFRRPIIPICTTRGGSTCCRSGGTRRCLSSGDRILSATQILKESIEL